ncbi:DNA polymerase I [uncultured Succiniclasticum sp.]|uniref:DNA polymerase I n=1 Tax=uncultured Succiniclasticum sp. TaxID=1500547 RepID=UPI0025F7FCE6|nr:DNA polymerase I [uncultured Succiniclasticum sp.]
MSDKFLVIDGSSLIHRAFFALPPLTTRKGQHTGAVYGFLRMFHKLLQDVKPRWVAAAFDKSRKTFRTKLYADYKGQRKPTPPELKEQFPLCMEVLQSMGIPALELDDYEADDIIGTFAKKADPSVEVYIVTGDRDELQLIDDRTRVMYTKKGISDIKLYDKAAFAEDYEGLVPLQLIDLKGLMGDTSDNIPGVPGVGPKTALKLIGEYGSVENVLEHVDEVKGKSLKEKLAGNKEQALLSKELATIYTEVPGLDLQLDSYALKPLEEKARQLLADLEFRGFFNQFGQIMGVAEGVDVPSAAAAGGNVSSSDSSVAMNGNIQKDTAGGNLFAAAASGNGAENQSADINRVSAVADDGMGSLFGTVVAAAEVKEIGFAAQWQEAAASMDPSQMVWFMTETAGEIPDLQFTGARVLCGEQEYLLSGTEALAAFTQWLGKAPNPKGTAGSKEVFRTCFCQHVEPVNIIEDITLAAYLDDPGRSGYALTDLAWHYLGQDRTPDCHTLVRVAEVVKQALQDKELTSLYKEMELPLARVLAKLELAGVSVDETKLDAMSREMAKKILGLEELAREQAGDPGFNPNSPKQLGVVLFEKLGLPVIKKTKTGYSTDVKVLEELRDKHPLVETILQYRVLAKLQSTYLEGLKPLINRTTGRIHTHFQQTVTVTGRLSSTDPNLQNIPTRTDIGREIRALFVPAAGYDWLMSCDYSQIELRILAHVAQDPLMLESFRENQDVHARTASEVFGMPLDQVSPEMRRRAKAVNFGIVYGISDFGLAVQLGCSRQEAGEFIKHYLERYQGVKEYMERMKALARSQGYVSTLLGRRRYLPDINNRNFNLRSFAERTAINTPIQGTAADIMKLAMLRVDAALQQSGLSSRVLLQVHDELVLEVKETEREATAALVQTEMQNAFKLDVPLLADVNYGKDWASAK